MRNPTPEDGLDPAFIDRLGRGLLGFLHDRYFRVELAGLEHVPARGAAVLAGVHRGFVPLDAILALHAMARFCGRHPRFLTHPGLLEPPIIGKLMVRLGGIPACRAEAEQVLRRGGILGVFPEGVRGAFTLYRDAYRLRSFGRHDFVKLALRHQAPILPFVTVGSAEVFPILAAIRWRWWRRRTRWPFFPITPTFPLLPLPLPSKWHTRFLEPLHVAAGLPPETAEDPALVRMLSHETRRQLQRTMDDIRRLRPSIFYGSILK